MNDYERYGDYLYTLHPCPEGVLVRLYDATRLGYPLVWHTLQGDEKSAVKAIESFVVEQSGVIIGPTNDLSEWLKENKV